MHNFNLAKDPQPIPSVFSLSSETLNCKSISLISNSFPQVSFSVNSSHDSSSDVVFIQQQTSEMRKHLQHKVSELKKSSEKILHSFNDELKTRSQSIAFRPNSASTKNFELPITSIENGQKSLNSIIKQLSNLKLNLHKAKTESELEIEDLKKYNEKFEVLKNKLDQTCEVINEEKNTEACLPKCGCSII